MTLNSIKLKHFCWVEHSSDSACCSCSLCFPRRMTGVQTLRLMQLWLYSLYVERNPLCLQILGSLYAVYASYVERHIGAFGSYFILHTLIDESNRWSIVEKSICVQPVATALYWDRNFLKKACNFVTRVHCCCAYANCVTAPFHLFLWE